MPSESTFILNVSTALTAENTLATVRSSSKKDYHIAKEVHIQLIVKSGLLFK